MSKDDPKEELERDLRNSLIIAEDVLYKRFPSLKEQWDSDKIRIITEVGLVIFKEIREMRRI